MAPGPTNDRSNNATENTTNNTTNDTTINTNNNIHSHLAQSNRPVQLTAGPRAMPRAAASFGMAAAPTLPRELNAATAAAQQLLAAVVAFLTFPELLGSRAVMLFIDNMAALSAIVHGYARKPDCASMVNAFHGAVKGLRCFVWAEWVPSKANISDWASRPDLFHRVPATAVKVPLVLPFLVDFLDVPE